MSYCQQCADLERMLRASEKRNNMLRAQYAHMALKHSTAEAEVARLREALEKIATMKPRNSRFNKTVAQDVADAFYATQAVARAALQAVEETP